MNKIILSLSLAGVVTVACHAQQNLTMLKYSIGFPMGDLQEDISKTSWRGVEGGYRYFADGNVAIGVDIGFQTFFERKEYDTYTINNASLTGIQYRYSWNTTMTGQVEWVLNEGADFRPFLGVGAGTMYAKRITDFGLYRFTQDPWQFLMKPEIGATYYMSGGTAIIVAAEYNAAFETKDMEGQSFLALTVGLVFGD